MVDLRGDFAAMQQVGSQVVSAASSVEPVVAGEGQGCGSRAVSAAVDEFGVKSQLALRLISERVWRRGEDITQAADGLAEVEARLAGQVGR